jgi:hypothetical protein
MDKPEQFQCQSKPAKLAIFAGKARLKSRELPISGELFQQYRPQRTLAAHQRAAGCEKGSDTR